MRYLFILQFFRFTLQIRINLKSKAKDLMEKLAISLLSINFFSFKLCVKITLIEFTRHVHDSIVQFHRRRKATAWNDRMQFNSHILPLNTFSLFNFFVCCKFFNLPLKMMRILNLNLWRNECKRERFLNVTKCMKKFRNIQAVNVAVYFEKFVCFEMIECSNGVYFDVFMLVAQCT